MVWAGLARLIVEGLETLGFKGGELKAKLKQELESYLRRSEQ